MESANGKDVTEVYTEYWWTIPLVMMIFCFFMMRGVRGSSMCGFCSRDTGQNYKKPDTALDIMDKQYAIGAINKDEYEEKKKTLEHSARQTGAEITERRRQ